MSTPPTLGDVQVAAATIAAGVTRTPLVRAEALDEIAGAPVWLKAELLQHTGSFKLRGALNRMQALSAAERAAGVVTVSAGNHAAAVARAGALTGTDVLVLMPRAASATKVAATRGYGATVDLASADATEAFARMQAVMAETGRIVIHPFDDPAVIAGAGTVGLEIADDLPDVDLVVCPVGGGGLLSGIASVVKAMRPEVRVIGVEAASCAPYVGSLEHGTITPVPQTETIADGIAVKHPGEITFQLIRELVDDVVTVTDAEISQTIVQLLERSKAVVEGAGAVGLAALLAGKVQAKRAVAVLSGGNIDTPLLMQVIRFGLTNAGRYLVIRTRLIDRPGQLMHLLKVLADAHINILVVSHHRESVDVAVAETGIELILETRDEAHAHSVIELVRNSGYPVTRMH